MDKKSKAQAASSEPDTHIAAAREAGLRYSGKATSLRPPGSNRTIPGRHLTPEEVAYYVKDRKTLLWLLDQGFRLPDPPAAPNEE